jgi:hypothetical protein
MDFVWLDSSTGVTTPIASFTYTEDQVHVESGRPPSVTAIPFTPKPVAAITPVGVMISDGRAPEIREYDTEGRTLRILRIDEPGRPVTPEMIDARIDLQATTTGFASELWEPFYSEMEIPNTLPSFMALIVDKAGWLWARVYEWDPGMPGEWIIFDPQGRAQGRIQTPPGLDVRSVGDDFILGVLVDDLGVEYVHRLGLKRGPLHPEQNIDR